MKRTIQQIVQQLISRLPENRQYYRMNELYSDLPTFIVGSIRVEADRKLFESLNQPETEWADFRSEAVQNAWHELVEAVRVEAHLPADRAQSVIETAVTEVLKILVQPRKNIPDIIFRQDNELTYDEIYKRVKAITVYRHFGQLIPRYMQKKEMEVLSRERCAAIIRNTDERLTGKYTPLNWAQMLEPLFELLNGEIDTNLLRLFFEDKNRLQTARRFDLMNTSLNQAQLIETLSAPDLLNIESYEDDQSSLFENLPHMQKKKTEEQKESLSDEGSVAEGGKSVQEQASEKVEEESASVSNIGFSESEPDEAEEKDHSINAFFSNGDSDNERGKGGFVPVKEEPEDSSHQNGSNGQNEKLETNGEEDQEADDELPSQGLNEETPMWMRFLEDSADTENSFVSNEENGSRFTILQESPKEPDIDLSNRPQPFEEERKELLKLLSTDKELFVKEIFGGSKKAFDEAVEEIIAYKNWQSASKYIEKEIFKPNLVNIYSEPAVNFTDRLQKYFLEKQNRK